MDAAWYAVTLHPRRRVDGIPEQAEPGHLFTDHPGYYWTGMYSHSYLRGKNSENSIEY